MTKWFGPPWPSEAVRAPVCQSDAWKINTPVGERCILCQTPIREGERGELFADGSPVHIECSFRSVTGNLTHVLGNCHHVGECNQIDQRPYRVQAVEVWNYYQEQRSSGVFVSPRT
jgi:hypothetical protein